MSIVSCFLCPPLLDNGGLIIARHRLAQRRSEPAACKTWQKNLRDFPATVSRSLRLCKSFWAYLPHKLGFTNYFVISFNFIFLLSAIFWNTSTIYEDCSLIDKTDNSSFFCICFIASCSSESSNKLTATQKKFFLRPSL